jgi:hemerythrin
MMMKNENESIAWSSKLKCGIKLIDDQHKELVDLINEIYDHVTGNNVQKHHYLNKVIKEAVKNLKSHFATEEKIMLAAKFAGYAEHKKEHDKFVFSIIEKISDYKAGNRDNLSTFAIFLKDWALSHIAFVDKLDFEFLEKRLSA